MPRSDGSALTGVKGREISAYSSRQKISVQHLICEATRTEDSVKYSFKTTLVWRTEWIGATST